MRVIWAAFRPVLLLVVMLGMVTGFAACGRAPAPEASETPQPEQESNLTARRQEPSPESAAMPAAEWIDPPQCRSQPLGAEALGMLRANPLDLQRAASLTHAANTRTLLAKGAEQSVLTGLAFNVVSGRMNRATGLDLPDLPGVETVGELMDRLEEGLATRNTPAELVLAAQQVQAGQGIARPVCARLYVTQIDHQPELLEWSGTGLQAASAASALEQAEASGLVMDGGQLAPDGKRAAFTSLGYETGGPVFVQDISTGAWTNLIEKMNAQIAEGQPQLQDYLWWEVIGWFPDSQRLMIGPAELSSVFVVDLDGYTFQVYKFPGGGTGGSGFVQLAPDGSRFVFVNNAEDGSQALSAYELATGQISMLVTLPAGEGLLRYPRFAPDGSSLAYLVEKGHPTTGLSYAIDLYTIETLTSQTLVEGNLGATVPAWSPDGQRIAFTRKEQDEPDLVIPEQAPPLMRGNVWVVPAVGGTPQQVTYVDGWARSPAWDYDSRTLAFVTQDGQVGMVDIGHPGRMWIAAETSPASPLMTSTFFVP